MTTGDQNHDVEKLAEKYICTLAHFHICTFSSITFARNEMEERKLRCSLVAADWRSNDHDPGFARWNNPLNRFGLIDHRMETFAGHRATFKRAGMEYRL